jgi:hypothetical protein
MRRTGLGFSSWFPVVSRGDALGDLPDVQAAGLSPDPQGRAAHGVLISIALLAGGGIRLGDNIDATATGCQSDTMPGNVPLLSVLPGRPTPACAGLGVGWVNRLIGVGLSRPVAISSGLLPALWGCWAMLRDWLSVRTSCRRLAVTGYAAWEGTWIVL